MLMKYIIEKIFWKYYTTSYRHGMYYEIMLYMLEQIRRELQFVHRYLMVFV